MYQLQRSLFLGRKGLLPLPQTVKLLYPSQLLILPELRNVLCGEDKRVES
jgi:hypothetical protein